MDDQRCEACEAIILELECQDCTELFGPKRSTKTKCINGHDWNEENTKLRKSGKKQYLICAVCQRENNAIQWQKRKYKT